MAETGGTTALDRVRSLATSLAPGELLPSERALAAELGVARMTVRGAIDVLEREGLVRTRRGVGTERLAPPVRLQVRLRSFASAVREHGLRPETRLLSYARGTERPAEVSAHLRLADDAETVHLRRLRLGDDRPLALEDAWLPTALVPQLDREAAEGSLYELLEALDLLPTEGVEVVTAALPNAEEIAVLEIAPTYPVLRLSRTAVSHGLPVEYSRVTFPADRYELTFPLAERLSLPSS
ncbi:GntR family transcriptional regulator [Agrococcus sp. ARC_14]|uniref:GntR family transcriptional regulator n=1 Tax=Agrococcus sp. ARC_14 TaxID=2919927 RepID=UPI001F05D61B|nr:GntR family transcriptional regulator [Agrococcus sp. ARC_14]MCH1881652.1 GntR family transcriptional regulator [Agrococcus sp. ARC_14]